MLPWTTAFGSRTTSPPTTTDLAVHFGFGPEVDAAQHGDDVAEHLAVDVVVAEHCDGSIGHRTGDARVAEHGDHGIRHIPVAGGRAEHRDHGFGVTAFLQLRVPADGDDRVR